MITKISIEQFVTVYQNALIIDVRSPIEFDHSHIPSAINIPLFSNEERKEVGTIYKEQGKQTAIKKGLDFFGPKMKRMVEEIETISNTLRSERNTQNQFPLYLYCARGGMRSAAMAWLLSLYGFEIYLIVGGYKAFRKWVLNQFEVKYPIKILGGFTGSKKTSILKEIKKYEAVIDLEFLANHKGSTFGGFNQPKQTSNELFENKLAFALHQLKNEPNIWFEDESKQIGFNQIPNGIWYQMREAQVCFLEISFEERLKNIIEEYGNIELAFLKAATRKISSQLGGLETKNTIQFLDEGNINEAFRILLKYYDKYYKRGLEKRAPSTIYKTTTTDFLNTIIPKNEINRIQ